jgi:putative phosphoesterase
VSVRNKTAIIGIISDTHGVVRPEAVEALAGSHLIIHAGDIGGETVLRALEAIAPVVAVRGNNDTGDWAEKIPITKSVTVGRTVLYAIHNVKELAVDPVAERIRVVISGHSHKPGIREQDGVLFINPGSAGPRRFTLPVSVARIEIRGDEVIARLIKLKTSG